MWSGMSNMPKIIQCQSGRGIVKGYKILFCDHGAIELRRPLYKSCQTISYVVDALVISVGQHSQNLASTLKRVRFTGKYVIQVLP